MRYTADNMNTLRMLDKIGYNRVADARKYIILNRIKTEKELTIHVLSDYIKFLEEDTQ